MFTAKRQLEVQEEIEEFYRERWPAESRLYNPEALFRNQLRILLIKACVGKSDWCDLIRIPWTPWLN